MLEIELAQYTHDITFKEIDPKTLHILKRNLLDSYAAICASLQDSAMLAKFHRMATMVPAEKGIGVWGIAQGARDTEAVFMNTILGRRSDLVNSYIAPNNFGGSHPSDNVSLILTVADWLEKGGAEVLAAMHVAFMLSCAFAIYYDPLHTHFDHDVQAQFYTPLVIGFMIGMTVDQLTEVQRIAGSLGLAINQSGVGEITDWRHCTYAACAMQALQAVRMVLAGFKGPERIYEGEAGINQFMRHSRSFWDPLPDLGAIVFKQWPALTFCQTPIDVAVEIAQKVNDHRCIEEVQVQTYKRAMDVAVLESSYQPTSRAGRTHSLPYCVATALVKKTIKYGYFDDAFMAKERDITDLMPNITVSEDKDMTRVFPSGAPCKITVTLEDGSVIDGYRDYPHGDPRDPLSDQEIEGKAMTYLTKLVDGKDAQTMINRVWDLEKESSIGWLLSPLKQRLFEDR